MTVHSAPAASPNRADQDGRKSYAIELEHLTKRYGRRTAVAELSFTLQPGRVTGILGPNGSGEATSMKSCSG